MEIPTTWAPLLVSAVRDAVLYQEQLMRSATLVDRSSYQEHHLQLTQFLEYLKAQYQQIEEQVGIPLQRLL